MPPWSCVMQEVAYSLGMNQMDISRALDISCSIPGINCAALVCVAGVRIITNPTPGQVPPPGDITTTGLFRYNAVFLWRMDGDVHL